MRPIERLHLLLELHKARKMPDGKPSHIAPPKGAAAQAKWSALGYRPTKGGKTWAHPRVRAERAAAPKPTGAEDTALRRAVLDILVDENRPISLSQLRRRLPARFRGMEDADLADTLGHMMGFGLLHPDGADHSRVGLGPGKDDRREPRPAPTKGIDPGGMVGQLVLAWRDYPDPTTRKALERLLLFTGAKPLGDVGQTVPFDGIRHATEDDVWPDDPVVVEEAGWTFGDMGRVYEKARVRSAAVSPTASASGFLPTHIIRTADGTETPVKLVDGVAYTQDEWDSGSTADWEMVDGQWLFQGQVPSGYEVSSVGKSRRR